ncbi:MAG: site-specific DNA-methyltransferase [Malacoplasma sp.]|nr:site-specific DNA-methyltransferase [Mycoplasmataceae bacterium]MDY2887341.1 site-specific DNA-methyltransferase [Malacoplasma sp.]
MSKINLDKNKRLEDIYIYIYKLFPDCVTETKENGKTTYAIDFDKLKDFLSPEIVGDKIQRYELTWPDKNKTRVSINKPTTNTLRPIKEKSIDFDKTKNLYIEGDNLEVLKVLRDTYFGKIDVIYIDPPYNTGNDFIFKDKFTKDSTEADIESGNIDEEGNTLVANKAENGRYHTNWLNMIYPRLFLAKDLLSETGVIFISIDDHEYANLKKVCDEIFGEEKFVNTIIWQRHTGGGLTKKIITGHDYVLVYRQNQSVMLYSKQDINKDKIKMINGAPYYFDGNPLKKEFGNKRIPSGLDRYLVFEDLSNEQQKMYKNSEYFEIREYKDTKKHIIYPYRRADVKKMYSITGCESGEGIEDIIKLGFDKSDFDFPKPVSLIKKILFSNNNKNALILDFFSGSGTTAQALMDLNKEDTGNRSYILVQYPEKTKSDSKAYQNGFHTICDIGIERIKRAGENIKKENPNVDTGFKYLKIDTSNIKKITTPANELVQTQLENFTNSIKPNRSNLDLVFEVMLSKKIPLDTKIETTNILDKTIYKVNGDFLICCFDNNLSKEFIKEVAKLSPIYLVFKESSFESDEAIKNIEQLIKSFSKTETKFEII